MPTLFPRDPRCALRRAPARGPRLAALVVGAVVLAGVVGGCGGSPAPETTSQRAADAAADAAVGAEELCLPPECGTTVPFVDTDGYIGPEPSPSVESGAVVAGATVVTAESGSWWAQGLVANGGTTLGGAPVVRATLRGDAGVELAVVEAPVLVTPLRPGESSPFRMATLDADATQVRNVEWEVVGGVVDADATVGRSMELSVAWNRPAGGEPVSVPGYSDGGGPGTPLVTYLSVRNSGVAAVRGPRVVAAWLDGRGRVRGVAVTDVLAPGVPQPLASLDPGASADAIVLLGPPAAEGLAAVPPLLWGVGR